MTGRILGRAAKVAAALLAGIAVLAIATGTASATTIYNNTPPHAGNHPSIGFEATSTSEFGGQVEFVPAGRTSSTVTIQMSSWACQSLTGGTSCKTAKGSTFSWPVTLKVYNVEPNNEPGAEVTKVEQIVAVPFRPSANSKCPETPEGVVGWSNECFSGKAFKVKFTLNPLVKLPEKAIISVAYNTTDYGYAPTGPGTNVGQDSLNVVLAEAAPSVGTAPLLPSEELYVNSKYCVMYAPLPCTEKFSLAGEWGTYQPALKVTATRH